MLRNTQCGSPGLAFALLISVAPSARAEIAVSQAVVVLDEQPAASLIVTNTGRERAFVEVTPRRVIDPGAERELRYSPDPTEVGLLAVPRRLVLEPGERRTLTLTALQPAGETDQVWRTLVSEVAPPEETENLTIRNFIAYDLLVIQRPSDAVSSLSVARNGPTVTIRNDGNSFALLQSGEECSANGQCTPLVGKRLYAGETWSVTLNQATTSAWFRTIDATGKEMRLQLR